MWLVIKEANIMTTNQMTELLIKKEKENTLTKKEKLALNYALLQNAYTYGRRTFNNNPIPFASKYYKAAAYLLGNYYVCGRWNIADFEKGINSYKQWISELSDEEKLLAELYIMDN